jgi:hypothetical protein
MFISYLHLAQPSEEEKCRLLRMQLIGDAETWYSTLDDLPQNDFGLTEVVLDGHFIKQNQSKQITDLRNRFHAQNETVWSVLA